MSDEARRVLITGAAGGLGRALVEAFHQKGWAVIATMRRPAEFPDGVTGIVMDVSDSKSVDETMGKVLEVGSLDCVVNNAAVIRDGLGFKLSEEDWDRVIDACLKGAWRVSKLALRNMMKARSGSIINISSFSALVGHMGQANYAAAKAGLIGLTQSMAAEGGARNVRANVVVPGLMDTAMLEGLSDERKEELRKANLLGKMSDPVQVAGFVEYLAGMDQVSGQVFNLDSRVLPWT